MNIDKHTLYKIVNSLYIFLFVIQLKKKKTRQDRIFEDILQI